MAESMNDLFDNIEEAREERAAIMADSGIANPDQAAAVDLHPYEVRDVILRFFPDGDPTPYFDKVKEKRGNDAAERLIADCREAWRREIETRKAQRANVDSGKVAK